MTRPVHDARALGLAIRERRSDLGLSQQQLADRLGVSRQWIVGLEAGRERAELGLVLRALHGLELRLLVEPILSFDLDGLLEGGE